MLLDPALGSYLVTPFRRRRANWVAVLGLLEVAIAITGLLSAFLLVRANDVMAWMFKTVEALDPPYDFVLPLLCATSLERDPPAAR